jgi:hypothetical protein
MQFKHAQLLYHIYAENANIIADKFAQKTPVQKGYF